MGWFYLFTAASLEVVWTLCLKYSDGFTRLTPTLLTFLFSSLSFFLFSFALKTIPIGAAYAVWAGVGAIGVAVIGMIVFHEPVSLLRLFSIMVIIAGVVGLKVSA